MKIKPVLPLMAFMLLLVACSPVPAETATPTGAIHATLPSDTAAPTQIASPTKSPATLEPTPALPSSLQIVVSSSDRTIQLINPNLPLGPGYQPAFTGLLPTGGAIDGTAYVLNFDDKPRALAVNESSQQDLSFITNPNYGLAVWNGAATGQASLAWGTQYSAETPSSLMVSATDGSQLETLLTQEAGATPPKQLVAQIWSADGQSLYFSKEPVGLGGYIPFSGASSLFKIDIATKAVTELIPDNSASGIIGCLDAISSDYRLVADHCTPGVITVRDLSSGSSVTIQPPGNATDFPLMGSARFSPDGTHVVYALAKGNPDAEQGLLAIADSTGGGSKGITTGVTGSYYTVLGWLDNQTIVIQDNQIGCADCRNQVMVILNDGTGRRGIAPGRMLAVIENR